MKRSGFTILCLCLSILLSCQSSYKILKSEKEQDFRLSDYPTFGFYEIEASGDTISRNFEKNVTIIKEAIARNLQKRGLNEARDPALKINIALMVKEEVQTRETDFRTEGLPRYMGQRRYSWKAEEVVTGRYKQGTMLLDFVDATNNKLVWKSGAEGIIPQNSGNFAEKINKAIDDIFSGINN